MRRTVLLICAFIAVACNRSDPAKDKEIAESKARISELEQAQSPKETASLGAVKAQTQPAEPTAPELEPLFMLLGSDYEPAQRELIRHQVLSHIENNTAAIVRTLGYDILNSKGQVEMTMVNRIVRDFRKRAVKVYGQGAALRVLRNQWGDLAGSAIYRMNPDALDGFVQRSAIPADDVPAWLKKPSAPAQY